MMNPMAPEHAKPPARKDHLWVLAVIAGCALLEVWASWLGIGSVSGFPKLGKMTTGWILPVTTEAYWGYAVWAWLASSPGPRSRRFAMWTAIVMFTLSLGGQEAGHLVAAAHRQAPSWVVAFVTALPLIAVGLIAILIHLRQADREEAAEAVRLAATAERQAATERAEADDRAALRRELEALSGQREADLSAYQSELAGERSARESAQRESAQALIRVEALERKLAALSDQKSRKAPSAAKGKSDATQDGDVTTELRALMELQADPELCKPRMGGELARRLGVSAATGRRLHSRLTHEGSLSTAATQSLGERAE